jgi:hypothetical protein
MAKTAEKATRYEPCRLDKHCSAATVVFWEGVLYLSRMDMAGINLEFSIIWRSNFWVNRSVCKISLMDDGLISCSIDLPRAFRVSFRIVMLLVALFWMVYPVMVFPRILHG